MSGVRCDVFLELKGIARAVYIDGEVVIEGPNIESSSGYGKIYSEEMYEVKPN